MPSAPSAAVATNVYGVARDDPQVILACCYRSCLYGRLLIDRYHTGTLLIDRYVGVYRQSTAKTVVLRKFQQHTTRSG